MSHQTRSQALWCRLPIGDPTGSKGHDNIRATKYLSRHDVSSLIPNRQQRTQSVPVSQCQYLAASEGIIPCNVPHASSGVFDWVVHVAASSRSATATQPTNNLTRYLREYVYSHLSDEKMITVLSKLPALLSLEIIDPTASSSSIMYPNIVASPSVNFDRSW